MIVVLDEEEDLLALVGPLHLAAVLAHVAGAHVGQHEGGDAAEVRVGRVGLEVQVVELLHAAEGHDALALF